MVGSSCPNGIATRQQSCPARLIEFVLNKGLREPRKTTGPRPCAAAIDINRWAATLSA
jgi:hypothetical protein